MKEVVANPCNQYSGEEAGRGHKSKSSLPRTRRQGLGLRFGWYTACSTCVKPQAPSQHSIKQRQWQTQAPKSSTVMKLIDILTLRAIT